MFFLIALIFVLAAPTLYGDTCVLDGMNLWRLSAQIGHSVGFVTEIKTSSLPLIITEPGHYKVCENITAASSITINSDDVRLDLGGRFLEGVDITVSSGVKNIKIKNGLMRNADHFIDIGEDIQNIRIEDIVFDSSIDFGIRVAHGPVKGLTIRNVSFYNSAPVNILIDGDADEVSNVVLENISCVSTNQALPATLGVDATIKLHHCHVIKVSNFLITNPYQGLDALFFEDCVDIVLKNVEIATSLALVAVPAGLRFAGCEIVECTDASTSGEGFNYGFWVQNVPASQDITYVTCSAYNTTSHGFFIQNATDVACQDCFILGATGAGISITDSERITVQGCVANEVIDGITVANSSYVELNEVVATSNGGAGILLDICEATSMEGCTLNGNTSHGVSADGCTNLVMSGVIANQNAQRGFSLASSVQVSITDSSCLENGCDGITCTGVANLTISGTNAEKNAESGILLDFCIASVLTDCSALFNTDSGVHMDSCFGTTLRGITTGFNGLNGIGAILSPAAVFSTALTIADCVCTANLFSGMAIVGIDAVSITGCEVKYNGYTGFHIIGSNNGIMPGDPEGTVGTSPTVVEGCTAFRNGANLLFGAVGHGFYFQNVGGVLCRDNFASCNNGYGFWFNSGSWNVQVEGCYATSNTLVGFITWDTSFGLIGFSSYNNRFRYCFGSRNNTASKYNDVAALSDFAANNTQGTSVFPPIGAVFGCDLLGFPGIVTEAFMAENFCGYQ